MDELQDARRLLGVGASATSDDVNRAFRDAAKRNHPDMGGTAASFLLIERAFRLVEGSSNAKRPIDSALQRYTSAATQAPEAASRRVVHQVGSSFATVLARHLRDQPAGIF